MTGILLIDKPAGMTSAAVVREVKKRLAVSKVGHLGTLDPFATGLLPICLGEGAKIVPFLSQEDKAYEGTIRLGVATDTLDPTGREVATAPVPPLTEERLRRAAQRFVGEIEQVPPMFSAVKRRGVPLYRLARRGVEVERAARRVRIESLSLAIEGEVDVGFSLRCSKGTYVRVLAAELANALGTVGHLSSLRRTAFGSFRLSEAVALESLRPGSGPPILSLREALSTLREFPVNDRVEARIRTGQQQALAALPLPQNEREIAKVIGPAEDLVALVGVNREEWRILRVLALDS